MRSVFGRSGVPVLAAAVAVVTAGLLLAQEHILVQGFPRGRGRERVPPELIIEPSAPIADLFDRAEQGIARRDWKFVVDCLQRIIDDPQGSLLPTETSGDSAVVYESARRRALKRLASLPPEGLDAYRLVNDGRAKRLLDEARATHDFTKLQTVVDRYLLTRHGPAAVDLLASRALDAGSTFLALRALNDLQALVADSNVEQERVAAKLAAAYALLGRRSEAEAVVEQFQRLGRRPTSDSETQTDSIDHAEADEDDALRIVRRAAKLPTKPFTRYTDAELWPIPGGNGRRQALMPDINPTLHDSIPWRFNLPSEGATPWRLAYGRLYEASGPVSGGPALLLPIRRLVSDGDRLFVPTGGGCIALSKYDLNLVWRSATDDDSAPERPSAPQANRRQQQTRRSATPPGPWGEPAFSDPATGDVVLGFNQVVTVSRSGTNTYTQLERDVAGSLIRPLPGVAPQADTRRGSVSTRSPQGTRLVAFDAQTGTVVWQRGRTGDADDPLDNVEFLSSPLLVLGSWWAPYRKQNDLYIAALDPADGALRETLLLGTIQESPLVGRRIPERPAVPLSPAFADGVIYVPSGHGVLFAVDATDFSLRWASQYGSTKNPGSARIEGQTWLSAQAVLADGSVLLGSPERDELLAFSAADGSLEWSSPCDGCAYLIGAGEGRVWVGGQSLSSRSLADGETRWSVELIAAPTGQAVRCGSTVYAPTLDALSAFDALTGKLLNELPAPATGDPLGNPLCLNDSLYVLGPTSVRKYPDMEKMYPPALARYESDPADVAAAVRLAWLELLKGDAMRAHEILSAVPDTDAEIDPDLADAVSRARVEALLALAASEDSPEEREGSIDTARVEKVLGFIQQARRLARTLDDRLRCGRAEAQQLSRLNRHREAYESLWRLGTDPAAETVVLTSDQVLESARLQIGRQLHNVARRLADREKQELEEQALAEVRAVAAELKDTEAVGDAPVRLRAVADVATFDAVTGSALASLAAYHTKRRDYEVAEQLLREAADRAVSDRVTASFLVRLSRLYRYLEEEELDTSGLRRQILRQLVDRFASEPLAKVLEMQQRLESEIATDGPTLSEAETKLTVAEWARRSLTDRDGAGAPPSRAWPEPARSTRVALTGDVAWIQDWAAAPAGRQPSEPPRWLVHLQTDPRPAPVDRVLLQDTEDALYCYHAATGKLLWETSLRLPGMFPEDGPRAPGIPPRTTAVADGQTAVFSTQHGLFGVGLLTGRRLWIKPFDAETSFERPRRGAIPMAVHRGRLAATHRAGWLTLMRMADGSVIWERDLRGEPVAYLWQSESRIIAADEGHRRVNIFDRDTGASVGRVVFRQPQMLSQPLRLVLLPPGRSQTHGLLIGPVATRGAEGVAAIDLESGEEIWNLPLESPLVSAFDLEDGFLGVSALGGEVSIVDTATGDVVDRHVIGGLHAVTDALLVDGTLIAVDAPSGNVQVPRVVGQDVATESTVWTRDDVLVLTGPRGRMSLVGGCLAVAAHPIGARAQFARESLRIQMLDVRTGESVGEPVGVSTGRAAISRVAFAAFPAVGVVVCENGSALHSLRIIPLDENTNRGL